MKNFGGQSGIFFSILEEATCEARDPFPSSSFPGDFPFLLPRFSFFFPGSISAPSCATTRAPPIIHSCSSLLLLFLFSDQAKAAAAAATEAAARTEAEQRQAETAEGGSTELHFPAVFRPLQATIL